uniref:Kinetochore protein Spc24 n=1 Tax=Chelonoidis abingdonii TaxID=106734 RepID=A0A8C0GCV6_CHEAB
MLRLSPRPVHLPGWVGLARGAGRGTSQSHASFTACHTALRRELEELRAELGRLQDDMEDDGLTAAFHSYIAQLYYKISRIDWDYECEHPHIKGIHHGPAIAQPISLDSSQLSQCFVSDYLWSLVDTAW